MTREKFEQIRNAVKILENLSTEEWNSISSLNSVLRTDTYEGKIFKLMREVGIPSHVKGYNYVQTAIMLCIEDTEKIHCITKVIYPEIAKKFNTTSSRVERAIRHAIEIAWERGSLETIERIFGYSISCKKGKPTNSEFIAGMTEYIKFILNNGK